MQPAESKESLQTDPVPRIIRVAICQFESCPPTSISTSETLDTTDQPNHNTSLNLDKLEHYVFVAAQQKADLIVFPEYFITGVIAHHLHLASEEGKWLDEIKKLAVEHQIDIVAGSIVEKLSPEVKVEESDLSKPEALYNTAYYIDQKGEILGRYRKRNLCEDAHQVFDTKNFRAGMLLCWDLAWPEAFRDLMKQGAEVIIVPACWMLQDLGDIGQKHDPHGLTERRMIDSMKSDGFLGGSSVAMPLKGSVIRFNDPIERLEVVEIDLNILEDARFLYKIREDYESRFKKD
ncbi:carbon-nitrogen hydrolase [Melampsora americana]|nr:carbon-nitrogen hydrolase [Melampsora americana]